MNTKLKNKFPIARSLIATSLAWLATCTHATALPADVSNPVFTTTIDSTGIAILVTLLAGITIAVLLALFDRLQSVCQQALRLVEIALRERTATGTNTSTRDDFDTFFAPSREPAIAPDATNSPPRGQDAHGRSASSIRKDRIFRVELAKDLLPRIHTYVTEFLAKHGQHNEAGGMFVGEYLFDAPTGVATFRIRGFVEAGPQADFSAGSIQFDTEYQAAALRTLQSEHPAADNLGCIHRHPGSLDVCSSGDLETDREAVFDSGTKALVFGIITLGNSRRLPSSLFYRDFKIDFYLMADETGLEYVPILPTVVDLPLFEPSPALVELHALRGAQAGFDLAVLKQLPDLAQATLSQLDSAAGVLLTAKFNNLSQPLQVWVQPAGALRLFHQVEDGSRHELQGPWTQAEVGCHVWLSQLLLKARAVLSASPPPSYQRHFGLLEDKFRLVAEVRAMRERYGDRAVLRRQGDTVYWEYTVHESGREFPVEIRYPENYPAEPPKIYSVKQLPPSPHRLGDHDPCWIDYNATDWNPARDTACICVACAHTWFACLLVYLTLGRWPAGKNH